MFYFLCKSWPNPRSAFRTPSAQKLYFIPSNPFSSSSAIVKSIAGTSNEHSFTVSYLIKSLQFPPEKALSASKYVNFETPDKPEAVVAFFRNQGFPESRISMIIRSSPPVLLCDPEKTLLPKIQFFYSLGISSWEVAKLISANPNVLKRSLEKQIIPSFNFFKDLLRSGEKTIIALKRFAGILCCDLQACLATNIEILRGIGVPLSHIEVLLTYQPRMFVTSPDKFQKIVEEVKEMGFKPEKMKFVLAVHALRAMSKVTWDKKMTLYKKWGWSEEDVFVAFVRHPCCMMASEEKIMGVMDFLVHKMGWESSFIARRPGLLTLSLEKRITPRCLFYQDLLQRGFIQKDVSRIRLLESPDSKFLKYMERRSSEEASGLLRIYEEKMAILTN